MFHALVALLLARGVSPAGDRWEKGLLQRHAALLASTGQPLAAVTPLPSTRGCAASLSRLERWRREADYELGRIDDSMAQQALAFAQATVSACEGVL